ncbi:MAG: SRPBCC family protein [Pseudomonadota bacterium]
MATVMKTARVNASPTDVWAMVSDVGNVGKLTEMITNSTVEGDHRTCVLADGQKLEESILSVDHDLRRMAYRVHESPFPIDEHAASMTVSDDEGKARITWVTDVLPHESAPIFNEAAEAMFSDLVGRLGGEA